MASTWVLLQRLGSIIGRKVGTVNGAVDSSRGGGSCDTGSTASSSTAIARWKQ